MLGDDHTNEPENPERRRMLRQITDGLTANHTTHGPIVPVHYETNLDEADPYEMREMRYRCMQRFQALLAMTLIIGFCLSYFTSMFLLIVSLLGGSKVEIDDVHLRDAAYHSRRLHCIHPRL